MSLEHHSEGTAPLSAAALLIRRELERLVRGMTTDASLREDLLQEALIHLWLTETRRPGQTASWYLQGCKFHLLHYLGSGRSVDSTKRNWARLPFAHEAPDGEGVPEQADSDRLVGGVQARELMTLLSRQLTAKEKAVLDCLAEGWSAREAAHKLHISHTMVNKHRHKIAELLVRLGFPTQPINGNKSPAPTPARRGTPNTCRRPQILTPA